MHSKSFLLFTILGSVSAAALNEADIPETCNTICKPMVELTSRCTAGNTKRYVQVEDTPDGPTAKLDARFVQTDNTPNKDGSDMLSKRQEARDTCVCDNTSFNVAEISSLCGSCISQNKGSVDAIDAINTGCQFSPATYDPSADQRASNINVEVTRPAKALELRQEGQMGGTEPVPAPEGKSGAWFKIMMSTMTMMATGEKAVAPSTATELAQAAVTGSAMSGSAMTAMSGMSGMSGMENMSGMSGMEGMSGMSATARATGMESMSGMENMSGMSMATGASRASGAMATQNAAPRETGLQVAGLVAGAVALGLVRF